MADTNGKKPPDEDATVEISQDAEEIRPDQDDEASDSNDEPSDSDDNAEAEAEDKSDDSGDDDAPEDDGETPASPVRDVAWADRWWVWALGGLAFAALILILHLTH